MSETTNEKTITQFAEGFNSLKEQFATLAVAFSAKTDFYKFNKITKKNNGVYELENRLREKVIGLVNKWHGSIHKKRIQAIKDYQLCTIDRALDLQRRKLTFLTNEKQPIIRTFVDRLVAAVLRGNMTTKVYAATKSGMDSKNDVKAFIERCYSSSDTKKAIVDASVDAVLLGNGFVRTGFTMADSFIADKKTPDVSKVYDIGTTQATMEYVLPFNIYSDPTLDFYDNPVIYRTFLPYKDILKKLKGLVEVDDDEMYYLLNSVKNVSNLNYNRVKLIKYYTDFLLNDAVGMDENNFYQVKVNNDTCEYIEYWDGPNLVIMVNGYIVYDGKNPLQTQKHPFKVISFTAQGGVWIGDGIGLILEGSQKLYDALFNIMFDLAKFTAGPMFLLRPGQAIEGMEDTLNYRPFSFHQLRGSADAKIESFQLPKPDAVNFKMMADILEMANFAIAPASYTQIQGNSRSASDANFRQQGLQDPILALSDSIGRMMDSAIKDWMFLAKHNMPTQFKLMVVGPDGVEMFNKMKLSDLEGNYLFETEFESIKDQNKVVDRAQLVELLGVLRTVGTDPVTGRRLVNMDKVLGNALELFNQEQGALLTEKDYYANLKNAEEMKIKLQTDLQKFAQQIQMEAGGGQPMQGGFPAPEQGMSPEAALAGGQGAPQAAPQTSSDFQSNSGQPAAQRRVSAGAILKGINE